MKTIKISAILCAAALALGIIGCTPKELDTNQYSDDAVTLASFGPNPVVRGAQLRFFGSNLQNVVEVSVPGIDPITDIELVQGGKVSEIRVSVPVEGPEVGIVSIKTKDGKVIKTLSELTYTEGIVFDSFTAPATAYPGDVITLKGDYMHHAHHVTFEGGESAAVMEGATRHEAKVVIPATAVTGKIILSDGAQVENLFYSEKELVIGKPSVNKLAKKNVKVNDELVITGAHLEMISHFIFTKGEESAVLDEFVIGENFKNLTVSVPDFATDGEFKAVSFAGDEFVAGEIACIMPTSLVVTNVPKAGESLVITGKDLDVVTKVDFKGAEDASFSLKDGALEAVVPGKAVDGAVTLFHANGNKVEAEYTLVVPAISAVAPLELYAGDEPVKVSGSNLDLVVKAFIGAKEVEIDAASTDKELTLNTTVSSVGGKVKLVLENGVEVLSEESVTMNYHSLVIVTSRPAGQHIGQEVILQGENMNLVESIYIGQEKVTKYAIRKDDEIRFLMPWCKVGSYELKFVLYSGDVEVQPDPIEVLLEQDIQTIWEGSHAPGAWGAGMQALAWGGFDWSKVSAGTQLIVYFTIDPAKTYDPVMRAGNGSWAALPSWLKLPGADGEGNVPVKEDGYLAITLTAADLDQLQNKGGLVICGAWFIVNKVQLITDISQETTIWEGEAVADNWADQPYLLSDGGAEFKANGVTAGTLVRFYVTPMEAAWKLQIVEGHWGDTYLSVCSVGNDTESGKFAEYDLDANGGAIKLYLTQTMIDNALKAGGWGGIFVANGDNCIITKITIQ